MGSSGNSGKRRADLEKEVGVVAIPVRDRLEDFDPVVAALEDTGVDRILAVTQDALEVAFDHARETLDGGDATAERAPLPAVQKRCAAARERHCQRRLRSSFSTFTMKRARLARSRWRRRTRSTRVLRLRLPHVHGHRFDRRAPRGPQRRKKPWCAS